MPITDCYTLLGAWPDAEVDLSVEALAAGMQARGVSRSLVTHTSAIFYDPHLGNAQVLQVCSTAPPLTPVAVINPLAYPECLEEIAHCLEQGITVFRLCPREHGYPLSGAFGPLREVLEHLKAARLVLADLVGLPAPALAAQVEDLFAVPTVLTVDGAALGTALHAGTRSPNVWVETSRLDAGGAVEAAVKHLGVERVVFGSGAPLRSVGCAVVSVQYAELSDADRTAIFEGNLQRVLG